MSLLIGRYEHALDQKNRLGVPHKFREVLAQEKGRSLFITTGMDGCLFVFLPSQWEKLLANDLQMFTIPDKEQERAFKRKFFSEAVEVELDSAGRILIPGYLKEAAGLRGEVFVHGTGKRAEIWDPKRWQSYSRSKVEPTYKKVSKSIEI